MHNEDHRHTDKTTDKHRRRRLPTMVAPITTKATGPYSGVSYMQIARLFCVSTLAKGELMAMGLTVYSRPGTLVMLTKVALVRKWNL